MVNINLLNWREQRKQQQRQRYISQLLIAASAAFALVFIMSMGLQYLIDQQQLRNATLNQEIAILDAKIQHIRKLKLDRDGIGQRMALVESLQRARNLTPMLLDELAQLTPNGVYFVLVTRRADQIEIEGISESNNQLAKFMRALQDSKVFYQTELSTIQANTDDIQARSNFNLRFRVQPQHLIGVQA